MRLGVSMAVLVERRCRHGGMRLHYVRIHVLLRLHANLLHAMSGLVAAVCVGSGSLPASLQPVRWQAGSFLCTGLVGEHVAGA